MKASAFDLCRHLLNMDKAIRVNPIYVPQHDRMCPLHGKKLS